MRLRSVLALPILLLLALSAACDPAPAASGSATQQTQATSAAPTTASGGNAAAIFKVVKADGSSMPFTIDDLKQLPLTSIMSDGSPQEGPALLAVLTAAKVTDFTQVTLTGSDGTKTLQRADVTPDVILDFNNRGSVKLVSPTMARADRIRDITLIEVK